MGSRHGRRLRYEIKTRTKTQVLIRNNAGPNGNDNADPKSDYAGL